MSEKNKNMDNEQTVYIPGNESVTGTPGRNPGVPPVLPDNAYAAQQNRPPQMPPNNAYGAQQNRPPQMPPNNAYGAPQGRPPQMPPNNAYGAPQGRPSQMPPNNMYGAPAGYGDPRMRQAVSPNYGKKGSTAVIVLVVMIVLLVCAIAGIAAFIILNEDDSGRSDRDRGHTSFEYGRNTESDEEKADPAYENETQAENEKETEPVTDAETTASQLITTPNVTLWDGNQAAEFLRDMGFVVEIVNQYSSEPAGTVISQDVASGTSVSEGTKIVITVSQGEKPEEQIVVPDVRGMASADAQNVLQKSGLIVNSELKESDTVEALKVIEQSVAPGTKVEKGTYIFLEISKGSGNQGSNRTKGKVVTKETELNVRKGPGKEYEVIGTVDKDSIVEISTMTGDWYEIVFKNGVGYVSKDYIQLVN